MVLTLYNRLISLPKNKCFFLFGQRGTGKTTLLKNHFSKEALELSLLDSKLFLQLSRAPWELQTLVKGRRPQQKIVILDEIQKVPLLLDEVHKLIEEDGVTFALTGSSARKLKRAGTNLLAGRAFTYHLYPLTHLELGKDFDLDQILQWGSLPRVMALKDAKEKEEYLYAYATTYLKEEIILEQLVRQIDSFSRFLEIAAHSHAETVSFSNIAKDVGISSVSVKNYFEILTDTLIGFFLPAFHKSIRKKQKQAPKFYFYDNGLARALLNRSAIAPHADAPEYGKLFESFILNEILRLNEYRRTRYQLSHLRIDDKDEVDLIIERPGLETLLVEVKAKREGIRERDVAVIERLGTGFKKAKMLCLSQDPQRKKLGNVLCLPWQEGIAECFSK